jgi:hypothetical protein
MPMQTVYFGRCIPWIIIDAIPYFRKWKLQPGKVPTPQEQWECTKGVLFSHFTVEGPAVSTPFGLTWPINPLIIDLFVLQDFPLPAHRRVFWHEYLAGPLLAVANYASTTRLLLFLRGHVSLLWSVLSFTSA